MKMFNLMTRHAKDFQIEMQYFAPVY